MSNDERFNECYQDRCREFIDDMAKECPGIALTLHSPPTFSWVDFVVGLLAGTEWEVRGRQTQRPDLTPENVQEELITHTDLLDQAVYINWGDCSSVVEIAYKDLISDSKVLECALKSICDDIEMIVPGRFIYSIDHEEQVWFNDLTGKQTG